MKKLFAGGLAVLLIAGLTNPVLAKGSSRKGKKTFTQTCVTCHGKDGEGNQALNAPSIASLQEAYVDRQLKNFKAGIRGTAEGDTRGAQMKPMAMTLADDEAIADVAAYVAKLKMVKSKETVKGDAAAGKAAYATCMACHGTKGEGNDALNAPQLSGLNDWYIVNQLKGFKAGYRGTHKDDAIGAGMRGMAMALDDKKINDLAAYIVTLK